MGEWLARRRFPLLATVALIGFEMASTLWWGPALLGVHHWSLPEDLWGTLVAAQRLAHGNLAGLYTPPTALIAFPGTAIILIPVVLTGVPIGVNWALAAHPAAWLVAGPYEIAISAVVLFAADNLAERTGVSPRRRGLLALAETVALWGITVRWGHPEDAVAVGLLLYALLPGGTTPRNPPLGGAGGPGGPGGHGGPGRPSPGGNGGTGSPPMRRGGLGGIVPPRQAWLIGTAIAVQPLVLLALPVVLAALPLRRLPGFLVRAAAPPAVLLGAAAAANWSATYAAVTSQPNSPVIDHPTLWTALAPHMSGDAVAAGPARLFAIIVSCACAVFVRQRWRRAAPPPGEFLWWIALVLALRSVFEPVMVAYYLWPTLAVALIASATSWRRLSATALVSTAVTLVAQIGWHGPWTWWVPMLAGLGLTLFAARPSPPLVAQESLPEPVTP